MKRRIYQLGCYEIIQNEDANAILRGKDAIILLHGEKVSDKLYKDICNSIRKSFNFNYLINVNPYVSPEEPERKDLIIVIIFEIEKKEDLMYEIHYDQEKDSYYIEIED